jgi:methionyl-tRNA formyltransferase
MNVVYFSGGERGRVCLQSLVRSPCVIRGVVAAGTDAQLEVLCREHGLALYVDPNPNTLVFANLLASLRADVFVCSGYNRILKPLIFRIPSRGTLNLHGGRLPEYRGAAPINWQIINGEVVGGCCVLFMDEGIDTGPIAKQELYPITENDTHRSVLDKTFEIFPTILRQVLEDMESGTLSVVEQRREDGCHYSRRVPDDSRIHWRSHADRDVHNLVRGMQGPYPHAFTMWRDEEIQVERTTLLRDTVKGISGRVALTRGSGVIVICRDRGILVEEIRIRGQGVKPREVVRPGDQFS